MPSERSPTCSPRRRPRLCWSPAAARFSTRSEVDVAVEPLAIGLGSGAAIDLFAARAQDVNPTFRLTADNAESVTTILPPASRRITPRNRTGGSVDTHPDPGRSPDPAQPRAQRRGCAGFADPATYDASHARLEPWPAQRGGAAPVPATRPVSSGGFTLEAVEAVCPDVLHPTDEVLASMKA